MNKLILWAFKTVVGRWVTVSLVALLLGGAALKWYNFKQKLVDKGTQVCVQEINKDTMLQLEEALAAEKAIRIELAEELKLADQENASARGRRRELETSLNALATEMRKQRNEDETYKKWSDTPLPDGVGDRLRNQATGGDPGPVRDAQD